MKRRRRKTWDEELLCLPDSDEQFAYIAGYTEGGFPYGITWEEHWASQVRHDDEPDDLGNIFSDNLME
ncbi:hypothetical protein [Geobacter sp.]|uniref:hypothetical protein n=1 Tax=Geobacter sp. TaxID=46610 RepID=UPI00262F522E|nr:hypothetical protein [Geobacter sp.]